ncbi:MAG: hypothetical protein U0269_19750 [Polyangiales bacterium]
MSLSLHDQLRSTLDELAASDFSLSSPGASLVVQHYGDALRAGITVPMALRKRLHSADLSALRAIADEARNDLDAPPASLDAFDDPSVELALRARDQLESVLVGLRRIALAHGLVSDEFDPIYHLAEALEQFDQAAAKSQSRNRVEQLLAERMSLHASTGWLDRYEHRDRDAARPEVRLDASSFRPTHEQLTLWATRGVGSKAIEAWATHEENADDLRALLDALQDEGVPLSLNALRWSRARAGSSTVEWAIRPMTRLAAASSESTEPMRSVDLGQLGSLRAFARLLVTSGSTLLRVRAEPHSIRHIQFGDQSLDAPDARDTWTIEVRAPHGPLALIVTDSSGEIFRCTLVIGPVSEG